MDIGSPLSNSFYLGSPKGEIYGLDHTVKRFGSPEILMHLRPETEITGLVLTGKYILVSFDPPTKYNVCFHNYALVAAKYFTLSKMLVRHEYANSVPNSDISIIPPRKIYFMSL